MKSQKSIVEEAVMHNSDQFREQVYSPARVLIMYADRDTRNFYIEVSDVRRVKDKNRLSAFRPISDEEVIALSSAAKDMISQNVQLLNYKELLPENVLYFKEKEHSVHLIWYNPPQKRTMVFTDNCNVPKGEKTVPGIIYSLEGKELRIYAYIGEGRPTIDQRLYVAPFYNCGSDGSICMGTIRKTKNILSIDELINKWEYKFWKSKFSHSGSAGMKDISIDKYWTSVAHLHPKKFPVKYLNPRNDTLKHLIQ